MLSRFLSFLLPVMATGFCSQTPRSHAPGLLCTLPPITGIRVPFLFHAELAQLFLHQSGIASCRDLSVQGTCFFLWDSCYVPTLPIYLQFSVLIVGLSHGFAPLHRELLSSRTIQSPLPTFCCPSRCVAQQPQAHSGVTVTELHPLTQPDAIPTSSSQ